MKWTRHGHVELTDEHDGFALHIASNTQDRPQRPLLPPVRRAIGRTRQWLLEQQHPDGYWVAELEGDTILESETILLLAFLGREDSDMARRLAEYLLEKQLPDGGWARYPGGGAEVSGSVKAYFALKLTGHAVGEPYMQRAHRAILAHGGADAVNSYTRFFLAMLGQIPYEQCPAVPPEAMLLPKWFPMNLYAVSTWSRTIIVPLSIVSAYRPLRHVPAERGIRELFLHDPKDWPPLRCPGLPGGTGLLSWDRFFHVIDRSFKFCQRWRLLPLRKRAVKKALRWMLDRFQGSDGLGAIFPPIIFSLVALRALGYADTSPEMLYCHRELEKLLVQNPSTGALRVQPCKSPVWDTAIALRAISSGGMGTNHPSVLRAADWLLDRQVSKPGDWSETVRAAPGGWCFEFNNDFYPDSDDTSMVLMALSELFRRKGPQDKDPQDNDPPDEQSRDEDPRPPQFSVVAPDADETAAPSPEFGVVVRRSAAAVERGLRWMLAMQNDDGGWGAFDRNNNRQFLCYVPFADHNAMIDPSTPDLTGRVLESLGELGYRIGNAAVDRAVAYLRQTQEADGSWFGRWGVNYVYGTWQALVGLCRVGVGVDDPAMVAGANWLLACQQSCGGWGESPDSYDAPSLRGQGRPTASQTAWGLMGLLAAGLDAHPAVTRAVQFLVDRQQADGTWEETEFTGTGFPRVFYLRYHYYPIYFPLMALSRWAQCASATSAEASLAGASRTASTPKAPIERRAAAGL